MMEVRPGRIEGSAAAPPSKSCTHRAYVLAATADHPTAVLRPSRCRAAGATLAGLALLGASCHPEEGAVRFDPAPLRPPTGAVGCGDSATSLRLLAAQAARLPGTTLLDGSASLRRRGQLPLAAALVRLGATVQATPAGTAPLRVRGPMQPGATWLDGGESSQPASGLALAMPLLAGPSLLEVRAPRVSQGYLDLTLAMARAQGLRIEQEGGAGSGPLGPMGLRFPGGQAPRGGAIAVEGDWSAAAFVLGAAAVTGGRATVTSLSGDSLQPDRAVLDHLGAFGCAVTHGGDGATVAGPIQRTPGPLDLSGCPDLFPVLCAVAAHAPGTTTLAGAPHLRGKESDRVRSMADALAALGVRCDALPDGLRVHGGTIRGGAPVPVAGDHRIHMAAVVAALAAQRPTPIEDPACVAVSDPGFHGRLASLGAELASLPPSSQRRSPVKEALA